MAFSSWHPQDRLAVRGRCSLGLEVAHVVFCSLRIRIQEKVLSLSASTVVSNCFQSIFATALWRGKKTLWVGVQVGGAVLCKDDGSPC